MPIVQKSRISIQASLSGYSFCIEEGDSKHNSDFLSLDNIFSTKDFAKSYDRVDLAIFSPKFTLVPKPCFDETKLRDFLTELMPLEDNEEVEYVELKEFNAVLVYSISFASALIATFENSLHTKSGEAIKALPQVYYMLKALEDCNEYNKIVLSYQDNLLYVAIAQGKTLLLLNSFPAPDFNTAQYYIFLCVKSLQLNPEISSLNFMTALSKEESMSLYRYFKAVEQRT